MDIEVLKSYFDIDTKKICGNIDLLQSRKWKIIKIEFPKFMISMLHPKSQEEYCFCFIYDDIPISLQVVDISNFMPQPIQKWPQGGSFLAQHSRNRKPFLCSPGIREYHTHISHEKESKWDFMSADFRLPALLDAVHYHLMKASS